jgi:mRNA interferase RelE/StbE
MAYQVTITATAVKERSRLNSAVQARVDAALRGLYQDARPPGAKKLSGSKHDWRIRVGDYRVLYEVNDADELVTIWRIAHRREVYR